MAFELLRTDYVDAVFDGLRRYLVSDNGDGSVSFHDITNYTVKEGAFFGAKDANTINTAVNAILAALENGTDLYEIFTQFFETQKELFKNESDTRQDGFAAYIDELQSYMSAKWDELKTEYTGDIQYFKDVQENAFNVWFQMIRDQLTNDVAGNLQNQIGNLNGLETEAKDSLTNAINEVHTDIETVMTEIVADVEEKVDSIRVLNAEATITKPGPWMIEFTKINNRSTQMYEPKDGDIIIVRFAAPYQGGNFTSVRLTGFYRGGYPIEYLLNCYSTEVYTSPFEGATVNMGYRNSIILNVVFKGNAPYFLLLNDLPFAQTERYKKAAAYQFPQKNLFLQSGAISMYSELDNAIKKRLECVENGEFTNDTIALALGTGCTYLLATVEYTMSSKAIYGYRMCMIAVPQTGVNKAVSRANLVASTNAGVTLANVAPEDAGYVYREVTMKATSTYGVSYALYELDAYYTGDF